MLIKCVEKANENKTGRDPELQNAIWTAFVSVRGDIKGSEDDRWQPDGFGGTATGGVKPPGAIKATILDRVPQMCAHNRCTRYGHRQTEQQYLLTKGTECSSFGRLAQVRDIAQMGQADQTVPLADGAMSLAFSSQAN